MSVTDIEQFFSPTIDLEMANIHNLTFFPIFLFSFPFGLYYTSLRVLTLHHPLQECPWNCGFWPPRTSARSGAWTPSSTASFSYLTRTYRRLRRCPKCCYHLEVKLLEPLIITAGTWDQNIAQLSNRCSWLWFFVLYNCDKCCMYVLNCAEV